MYIAFIRVRLFENKFYVTQLTLGLPNAVIQKKDSVSPWKEKNDCYLSFSLSEEMEEKKEKEKEKKRTDDEKERTSN